MKPMLARTYGPKFSRWPVYVQPKLNGVRALGQLSSPDVAVFQSRDEKLWKYSVLWTLMNELTELAGIVGTSILDGELYVHGWRLQRINAAIAVNRLASTDDTPNIEYHVFDTVNPSLHFADRWIDLSNYLRMHATPHIKVVPTSLVHDREQLERYFHQCVALGYEGVMLRPDGPYEFGETAHGTQKRSEFLWKYKSWEDGEFYCIGVTQGEGKADIGIGALVLCPHHLQPPPPDGVIFSADHPTFSVGTGFDDSERIAFMQNPPVGKMVKIRYLELTADGIPFNPSFLCVMP